METWKLDRICGWLMSGISINSDLTLRYYIDKRDKVLFNLKKEDGELKFKNYQIELSDYNVTLLAELRSRVLIGDVNIMEIEKTGNYSELLPIDKSISIKVREARWNSLGAELREFVAKNELILEEYHLIE